MGGARVVDRAVATAAAACDVVVVVLPAGRAWDGDPVQAAVAGGATRADSVGRRARRGARPPPTIVVVHDAARPLATQALFDAVLAAVRDGADAAVPGAPGRRHGQTSRRGTSHRDAAPRRARRRPDPPGVPRRRAARRARRLAATPPTTPRSSRRRAGRSSSSPASRANVKLTTEADLALVGDAARVRAGEPPGRPRLRRPRRRRRPARCSSAGSGSRDPACSGTPTPTSSRTPSPTRCSARPASPTSARPSPPTTSGTATPTPSTLLGDVAARVAAAGWAVTNVDVVVYAEAPHLAPHLAAMSAALSPAGRRAGHRESQARRRASARSAAGRPSWRGRSRSSSHEVAEGPMKRGQYPRRP